MKYVLLAILVAALCWMGVTHFRKADQPAAVASVPATVSPPPPAPAPASKVAPLTAQSAPAPTLPPEKSKTPAAAPSTASEWAAVPWPTTPPPQVEPTKPSGPPATRPQIVLSEVLGPNNLYHDDAFGVSASYPEGWTIERAMRWGLNNGENTVGLVPDTPTSARPIMYYQMYPNGYPDLEGPEAYFQRIAQNKESQRVTGGIADYKNVPSSFEFTEIDGRPAMSYFAVFTRDNQVQTEYYVRVLGKQGYVMFSVPGTLEDVQKIMPQIKKMAATVKVP